MFAFHRIYLWLTIPAWIRISCHFKSAENTEIGAFREIEVRGGTPFDFIIFLFLAIETDFRPIETLWDY
jgi:hypothetical protein